MKVLHRVSGEDCITELPAMAFGSIAWRESSNQFPAPTDLLTDLAAGDWSHEDLAQLLSGVRP